MIKLGNSKPNLNIEFALFNILSQIHNKRIFLSASSELRQIWRKLPYFQMQLWIQLFYHDNESFDKIHTVFVKYIYITSVKSPTKHHESRYYGYSCGLHLFIHVVVDLCSISDTSYLVCSLSSPFHSHLLHTTSCGRYS